MQEPEPPNAGDLAQRIAAAMQARRMSAHAVSRAAGLSAGTVKQIVAGRVDNPQAATLVAIARALDVSPDYLRGIVPDMDQPAGITEWTQQDEETRAIRAAVTGAVDAGRGMLALIAGPGAEGLGVPAGARVIVDSTAQDQDGGLMVIATPETGRVIRYRARPFWIAHDGRAIRHHLDTPETRVIGRVVAVIAPR